MSNDGLVVVEYSQNEGSFGWSVLALVSANYKPGQQRWGVLDAALGTQSIETPSFLRPATRTRLDVVRGAWNLVDWYPTERAARDAYTEAMSRQW